MYVMNCLKSSTSFSPYFFFSDTKYIVCLFSLPQSERYFENNVGVRRIPNLHRSMDQLRRFESAAGSTLTISTRNGGLFSVFLAIFISLADVAFWRILSFALHQIRSKEAFQDGFHDQQQLIFRNTSSASDAFWQMLVLPYYWGKNTRKAWIRTSPLALLALLIVVVFAIAAIFSSEVTEAPGQGVLIRSADCGSLEFDTDDNAFSQYRAAYSTVLLNDTTEASTYTRNCYGSDANGLRCNR